MITSFKATTGFAAGLEALQGRTFEFKPGVNIVFGPNGTGKSTMLKIIAALCGVKNGGWTKLPDWVGMKGWRAGESFDFPSCLSGNSPGGCLAEVGWDGTPTFFNGSAADALQMTHFMEADESADGMTSMNEQIAQLTGKPSEGMVRLRKLNKSYEMIEKPPVIDSIPRNSGEQATKCWRSFIEWTAGLGPKGPNTVLLDEPEKSLSIENQMVFWGFSVKAIGKERQLIIATHSPLALMMDLDWNFIDMEPGYTKQSRHLVKWMAEKGSPDHANLLVIFQKKKDEYKRRLEGEQKKAEKKPVAKKKAVKKGKK